MSKPRFSTICQQAKVLMVKIPNKSRLVLNILENYPKAAEIFFAEGMYWELYELDKKYPRVRSSISALKKVLVTHTSLPQEVYEFMEFEKFTPNIMFVCGRRAERAILNHKDAVEAMQGYEVETMLSILKAASELQNENDINISTSPLTKAQQFANKTKIIELLKETGNKDVINKLIPSLNNTTYYTKAHCNGHHNNFDGALAQHSLGVCMNALSLAGNSITRGKVILASLLHDLCDVRDFRDKNNKHVYGGEGHGCRSVELLTNLHVHLDNDVRDAIRYHLGSSKRSNKEKRELSKVWSSPLFSVLHVADHMDAGFVHCSDIGNMGAESYISLDCSALYDNHEFKQLKKDIEKLAFKYNIKLKQNKHHSTYWNKKRCSLRLLELGEKPWDALIPLTKACRSISRIIRECQITFSGISISKHNLVIVAEIDPVLMKFRDNLQDQFNQLGYSSTYTQNLTINIADISNTIGDTVKFLAELNQLVRKLKINIDALNLHYYKETVAGLYYLKKVSCQ